MLDLSDGLLDERTREFERSSDYDGAVFCRIKVRVNLIQCRIDGVVGSLQQCVGIVADYGEVFYAVAQF